MTDYVVKLTEKINYCLMPQLTRNFEELDNHNEFEVWVNNLHTHFLELADLLSHIDRDGNDYVIALILIFYHELCSEGPWCTDKVIEYSGKLNYCFELNFGVQLNQILFTDSVAKPQKIFDICMEKLHKDVNPDNFKKYPAIIEVYCSLLKDIKKYKIMINPVATLPLALLLVDDYVTVNKIKGLKSCMSVLECMDLNSFDSGNYYEVLYGSLLKNISEKDIEIIALIKECVLQLLSILPSNIKIQKADEVYAANLQQLLIESNLYKKFELFKFTKNLLDMIGIDSLKRNKFFMSIIYDNLNICSNDTVAEILLSEVLECLQIWIKHCWPVWCLYIDYKLLSQLLKILCVCKENHFASAHILFITLINFCSKHEHDRIIRSIDLVAIPNNNKIYKRFSFVKDVI